MKLELKKTKVIRSNEFQDEMFGIGDLALIMDIIRNKMYSNPIRACCQEIMSNARDAHREVFKDNVPIEVKLPTNDDPSFHIRDFGPGITPDRMSNVFIQYGASTKRDDNIQTGGFGLGAKSPFAYTDTFCIISNTPEEMFIDADGNEHENCMVSRNYIAHIDETRIGKLSLCSSEVTEEQQGTTILIAVKHNDIDAFDDHVRAVGQYWEVRPTVKGRDWKWTEVKKILKGSNWFIEQNLTPKNSWGYRQVTAKAIVDGIAYPLSTDHINEAGTILGTEISQLFGLNLRLEFETGELELTANREEINQTATKNRKLIRRKCEDVANEIQTIINDNIKKSKNFWEAFFNYNQGIYEYGSLIGNMEYDGIPLTSTIDIPMYVGIVYHATNQGENERPKIKAGGSIISEFSDFTDNQAFYFDSDESPRPQSSKVLTIFKQNPKLQKIYILKNFKYDIEDDKYKEKKERADNKIKELCLEKISSGDVSSFEPTRLPRSVNKSGYTIDRIKYIKGDSLWSTTDVSFEDLAGEPYLYVYYNKLYLSYNQETNTPTDEVDIGIINTAFNYDWQNNDVIGNAIYVIPTRFAKHIPDTAIPLKDMLVKKYDEAMADAELVKFGTNGNQYKYGSPNLSSVIKDNLDKVLDSIEGNNSLFQDLKDAIADVPSGDYSCKVKVYSNICRLLGKDIKIDATIDENRIDNLANKIYDQYPLLRHVDTVRRYDYYVNVEIADVIEYINLMNTRQLVDAEEDLAIDC